MAAVPENAAEIAVANAINNINNGNGNGNGRNRVLGLGGGGQVGLLNHIMHYPETLIFADV